MRSGFECELTPGAVGVDDWFVLLLLLANLQCRIYKIYAVFFATFLRRQIWRLGRPRPAQI